MKSYLRSFATRDAARQIVRMGIIGFINTFNYFVFFNILRQLGVSLFWSVTLAFAAATFISYVLNRRWTFALSGSAGGLNETANFYLVNLVAWGVTIVIVTGADALWGPLGILGENLASGVAALVILLPKFASYRDIVFRKALSEHAKSAPAADPGEPPLTSELS